MPKWLHNKLARAGKTLKVVHISERVRKEVVHDPPTNADTILLKMYKEEIDRVFCMDCVTKCKKRDAGCYVPVKTSIIDTS